MASNTIATLGIKVDPNQAVRGANKAKKSIKSLGLTASHTKKAISGLKIGMLAVGAAAILAVRSSIKYGASIENLQIQLKFLTGSTASATKAFKVMTEVASQTPIALQDIQKSSAALLVAVGNDVSKLKSTMMLAGEISVQFGMSFQEAALNLQKAFSAGISSADMFRDKGVKAMVGFREGVKYTTQETIRMFRDWQAKNSGALRELAETFDGKVSMMGDAWDKLLLTFSDNGALDETKALVDDITRVLKDPRTLEAVKKLSEETSSFGSSLWSFAKWTGKRVWRGMVMIDDQLVLMNNNANKFRDTLDGISQVPFYLKTDVSGLTAPKLPKAPTITTVADKPEGWDAKILKQYNEAYLVVDKYSKSITNATTVLSKQDKLTIEYKDHMKALKESFIGTNLSVEEQGELISKSTNAFNEGIARMEKTVEDAELAETMKGITDTMSSGFTDMIMNIGDGADALKDKVKSMAKAILAEFIKIQVAQPAAGFLSNLLSNIWGGGGGGNIGTSSTVTPTTGNFDISGMDFFAGGGFTGNGARSGGVDGQGGFPAILHPQETVTDHAKGQSTGNAQPVNVNFTIVANDTEGFDELLESREATFTNFINKAMNERGITGVTG